MPTTASNVSVDASATASDAPPERHHHFDLGALVDDVTIKPLTAIYEVLPRPLRHGVHNALSNLGEPDVALNDMLQGRPVHAASAAIRFATNSTIGIVGLFDVAQHLGAHHHDNDAATTLATYGVADGPHFHLPLIETDNLREAAGFAIDFVIDPVGWGNFRNADAVYAGQMVMDAVDDRSSAEDASTFLAAADQSPTPPAPLQTTDAPTIP